MPTISSVNPFEIFFQDPVYLEFKDHLYSYLRRKEEVLSFLNAGENAVVLEAGSGISPILEDFGKVVFSDLSPEAMRYMAIARKASRIIVMDVVTMAVRTGSVSAVICSEVLEHVQDDERAMAEMARVLEPGGQLIITVPVHRRFFALDDRFVGHRRRYSIDDLTDSLRGLGFSDFEYSKVTGFLDKCAALLAVLLFGLLAKSSRAGEKVSKRQAFLKGVFPFYVRANRIYSCLVKWEAKLLPFCLANVILVSCRKGKI